MSYDLSAERVTAKLREVSELRQQLYFSPARITRRLQRTSELRQLCLELQRVGKRNGLRKLDAELGLPTKRGGD